MTQLQLSRAGFDQLLTGQNCLLIPLVPRTKLPMSGFPLKLAFEGKYITSESDLQRWQKLKLDRAIVLGAPSKNLFCLDFDSIEAGQKFFDGKLETALTSTFSIQTSRGYQLLYRDPAADFSKLPSTVENKKVLDAELLLHHHLAACPLNTHPDGFTYAWLGNGKILTKEGILRTTLDRLQSLHVWTKRFTQKFNVKEIKGVSEGARNNTAFRYARYLLFTVGLDFDTTYFELQRWNALNTPPLSEKELQSILSSVVNYKPAKTIARIESARIS